MNEVMHAKYEIFIDIKSRAEFFLMQLCEGNYKSIEVYANNLVHLTRIYREFSSLTSDHEFIIWMQHTHSTLMSETAMIGRLIMAIHNFFILIETIK